MSCAYEATYGSVAVILWMVGILVSVGLGAIAVKLLKSGNVNDFNIGVPFTFGCIIVFVGVFIAAFWMPGHAAKAMHSCSVDGDSGP
jgi:hypothetical protein